MGGLVAIGDEGSNSDTDNESGEDKVQPSKPKKKARKGQRQRQKRAKEKREREGTDSADTSNKKAKTSGEATSDNVAATKNDPSPCWFCGEKTHRASGCLNWYGRAGYNIKQAKFMVMGLKPANDDVKGRPWFESDVSRQWWQA